MKQIILYLLLFLIFKFELISQNEFSNWHFGYFSSINFDINDGQPKAILNSQINTSEGCSSISDSLGNLLFYTDGVNIWNSKNILINPDVKLKGHYSSTQSALAIRQPGYKNLYYIFTVDAGLYSDSINDGLNFSILDMQYNNGLGNLISANNKLMENTTEKLTACYHKNGEDVWVITHEWKSNRFASFLLTKNGIEKTVYSNIGAFYLGDSVRMIGYLKFSSNGRKLAQVAVGQNFAELFDFDNESGKIFNNKLIDLKNHTESYGLEFSPNNKYLFITDPINKEIFKYDISSDKQDSINLSYNVIAKDIYEPTAIQLAPNGKIYISLRKNNYLACINSPDSINANYQTNAVFLGDQNSHKNVYGLPNFNQTKMSFNLDFDNAEFCEGDTLLINPKNIPNFKNNKYEWELPNKSRIQNRILIIPNVNNFAEGWYKFRFKLNEINYLDSIYVKIKAVPNCTLIIEKKGLNQRIIKALPNGDYKYQWSDGTVSDSILVSKSGTYSVIVSNSNGCSQILKTTVSIVEDALSFKDSIEFSETCVGNINTKSLILKNISDEDILISKISKVDANGIFTIKNLNVPRRINKNDSISVNIEFSPNNYGLFDGLIEIECIENNIYKYYKLHLLGTGIVLLEISTQGGIFKAGEYYKIPIIAKQICESKYSITCDLELKFQINKTLFYADSLSTGKLFNRKLVNDSYFQFETKLDDLDLTSKHKTISNLMGYVLTGTGVVDSIYMVDAKSNSPYINIKTSNAVIELNGCVDDLRPVQFFNPTELKVSNIEQYHSINIDIVSDSKVDFNLAIYNFLGQKIMDLYEGKINKKYNKNYILNNLNNGVYIVLLKSEYEIKSVLININD